MKKLVSLLKATMSQDMDLLKYKTKTNASKTRKMLFPLILTLIIMIAIGSYAFMFAEELSKVNLTYIMLTLFIMLTAIITIIEGIYKTQGILFEAKDNDLLFSLPINKSKILFTRIFKLISFQFLYNALFMVPALFVYICYEKPGISFYIISILMLVLLPIIPTIIAGVIGYIIKMFSTKFKAKKIIQTVLTISIFMVIFILSLNIQNIIGNIIENATNINDMITKIYYPAGLYANLIQNFNLIDLLILVAINIIPAILFIYIAGISYFKIISKSSEKSTGNKKHRKTETINKKFKAKKPIFALISKEMNRYFSSPTYIFNTSFGVLLMLVVTIGMSFNLSGVVDMITKGDSEGIDLAEIIKILPQIFYQLVFFTACMTSITSSSISLEGKSFNITKSLPTSSKKVMLSKIILSDIISIPLMLLSDIIFFIAFKVDVINMIYILAATFLVPTFIAMIGLLTNLKYPKMNASSDTEVVKQSTSTMISVLLGMLLAMISIILMVVTVSNNIDGNVFILIELLSILLISIILYKILIKYGEKRFREINV